MAKNDETVKSGEAGHEGRDRQPVKQASIKPVAGETAAANEVQKHSRDAAEKPESDRKDALRPGSRENKPRQAGSRSGGINKGEKRD